MRKTMTLFSAIAFGVAALTFALSPMAPAASTDGTVTITSKSVAVGVGVTWGDGVLTYQGKKHSFSVSGLSVVDVGASKISAKGKVTHLQKLADFTGNYVAAGAGAAVGGGAGTAVLKNQNGVEMTLTATTTGVKFALGGGGVEVKLK